LGAFATARCTICAAPNFAFQYLLEGVSERQVSSLDLRAWRLALNGAERIDAAVLDRFARHFAGAGFRPESLFPVYGLAEATLAVTFPSLGSRAKVDWVDRAALANEWLACPVPPHHPRVRGVVSVGVPVEGMSLMIKREDGTACHDREVGEVCIRGASVMSGYYRAPEKTAEVIVDGWLATGDLGYLADGELFVTGRRKELLKCHGENHFPEDLEACVKTLAGVHRQRCVAFVADDDRGERLVMMLETVETGAERERLKLQAARAIARVTGFAAIEVCLLTPGSILTTTSGKPRRVAMRERFEREASSSPS
jgi:fatty-acyl-CoA synthase